MGSSFRCPECGREYAFKPEYAGKRGKCVGCGHSFMITAPAAPGKPLAVANPLAAGPRVVAPTPRAPEAAIEAEVIEEPATAADDPGWMDAISAGTAAATPQDTSSARLHTLRKPKSSLTLFGRNMSPVACGLCLGGGAAAFALVGLVVFAVIRGGFFKLATQGEVSHVAETMLSQTDELTTVLRRIRDAGSAQRELPNIDAVVSKIAKTVEDGNKYKMTDAQNRRMMEQYGSRLQEAGRHAGEEMGRVLSIPGVRQIVEPSLQRFARAMGMPALAPPEQPTPRPEMPQVPHTPRR